jgi:hypothetical protein
MDRMHRIEPGIYPVHPVHPCSPLRTEPLAATTDPNHNRAVPYRPGYLSPPFLSRWISRVVLFTS